MAAGLTQNDTYFDTLMNDQQAKRDLIESGLRDAGFETLHTGGTYFLSVDIRSVGFEGDDVEFCEHLIRDAGVAAIPLSAFYQAGDVRHFVRFCFCKHDDVLGAAAAKLKAHFQ